MSDFVWTKERMAQLRHLWEVEGLTSSQIQRLMPGTTRSSIVGKAHRMELASRPSPIKRVEDGYQLKQQSPKRTGKSPTLPDFQGTLPTSLVNPPRAHTGGPAPRVCCWPFGEPRQPDFRFCGAVNEQGRPYCPQHVALAYIRRSPGWLPYVGGGTTDRAGVRE